MEPEPGLRALLERPRAQSSTAASFERELGEFVAEHYHRLIRLAGLLCRDVSDAEDAVQAALEQAWRRRESLRNEGSLKAWLDRIVVREAIRVGRRDRPLFLRLFSGPSDIEPAEPSGPPDPTGTSAAGRVGLRAAFDTLPAAQRAVVALHLHAGYSIAETADIVGVPLEIARSRLRLARERLREQLREDPR